MGKNVLIAPYILLNFYQEKFLLEKSIIKEVYKNVYPIQGHTVFKILLILI